MFIIKLATLNILIHIFWVYVFLHFNIFGDIVAIILGCILEITYMAYQYCRDNELENNVA